MSTNAHAPRKWQGGEGGGALSEPDLSQYAWRLVRRALVLGMWLGLSVVSMAALAQLDETGTRDVLIVAGIAVLVVAGTSVTQLPLAVKRSTVAVAVLMIVAAQGYRWMTGETVSAAHLAGSGAGFLAIAGTALVSTSFRNGVNAFRQRVREVGPAHPYLAESMREHATWLLDREISRATRYQRDLTVLVFGRYRRDGHSPAAFRKRAPAAGRADAVRDGLNNGQTQLRDTDLFLWMDDGTLAVLLPETGLDGAHVVAGRVAAALHDMLQEDVRAGIALFPNDGATAGGLLAEVRAAMQFAHSASIPVASRRLLPPERAADPSIDPTTAVTAASIRE